MKGEVEVMKLSLLYVVCQHEHYVQLNLPYPPSLFNTDKDKPLASHQVNMGHTDHVPLSAGYGGLGIANDNSIIR